MAAPGQAIPTKSVVGGVAAVKSERPRYRIKEKCYVNDRFYDPESTPIKKTVDEETGDMIEEHEPLIIAFDGVPGYYMEPVNDAARAQIEKYKTKSGVTSEMNPIEALSVVGR